MATMIRLYSVLKDAITFLMRGSYRRASASMRFNSVTRSDVATSDFTRLDRVQIA